MKPTHIDLFSGIGGFSLAARWNGIKTVVFCEQDKFCQKVLSKHWPEVPIVSDIRDFDGAKWAGAFILTGGFPCQPFSCAGKRRGQEDERFLWPEMLRVISEARPTWVIGENVGGFINMGLDDCIFGLENKGYEVQAFVIPACAVNAPHRRDRVWIVAHNGSERAERKPKNDENKSRRAEDRAECCGNYFNATDADPAGLQIGEMQRGNIQPERKATFRESWNENWSEVAARLCGVDARVSNRVDRLKSLGNAVVPQIPYLIMKSILGVRP